MKYTLILFFNFLTISILIGQIESNKVVSNTSRYKEFNITYPNNKILTKEFIESEFDSLEIIHESYGCFHKKLASIQIVKVNSDSVQITLNQIKLNSEVEKIYSITRSNSVINEFITFEKGGKKIKKHGCTTNDFYFIRINQDVSFFMDGSCQWEGYEKLLTKIQLSEFTPKRKAKFVMEKKYAGNIWPKDYPIDFTIDSIEFNSRFTPSKEEIYIAEKLILKKYKEIRKETHFFKRQYIGLITKRNQKLIVINLIKYGVNEYWNKLYDYKLIMGCHLPWGNRISQKIVNLEIRNVIDSELKFNNYH